MTVHKFQNPYRTVPLWRTRVNYWSLQDYAATKTRDLSRGRSKAEAHIKRKTPPRQLIHT